MKRIKGSEGYSLVDVVVGIVLLAMISLGITLSAQNIIKVNKEAANISKVNTEVKWVVEDLTYSKYKTRKETINYFIDNDYNIIEETDDFIKFEHPEKKLFSYVSKIDGQITIGKNTDLKEQYYHIWSDFDEDK